MFESWQKHHGVKFNRTTNATHYHKALSNFAAAAAKVQQSRAEYLAGNRTNLQGLTQYAHLSFEEFQAMYLGRLPESAGTQTNATASAARSKRSLPGPNGSLNWVSYGYVTPIKSQGNCGCCWAFASTGCIEGAYAKKKRTLVSFSEQQLVECVGTSSVGCAGGRETDAYQYVQRNGGLDTEASYGYSYNTLTYKTWSGCSSSSAGRVKQSFSLSYSRVASSDSALLSALINNGPIDVAIGVAQPFQTYVSGVMPSSYCYPAVYINHAVLLVGYNIGPSGNYWILKNRSGGI
jgi:hypothetical protein